MQIKRTGRLPAVTKWLYGAGDTGFSLSSTAIAVYFGIFLTDVVGVSPFAVGTVLLVARSWDYVNDPIIGYLSDVTRTKWGRRRPFLLFGAVPFAVAFALLWWTPPGLDAGRVVFYFAIMYVVYDTAASVLYMPYYALTPELTQDYDERTSLTSYRMLFSIVGSLLIFAGAQSITGASVPENRDRFLVLGIVIGVTSAISILITFCGTRERPRNMTETRPKLLESVKAVKNNRPFLYGLGIYVATWVAIDMMQAVLLFFVKYVLAREPQSDLILGSIFVSAVVTLPLWSRLSRRWGKRKTYIFGILFWIVVQSVLISLGPGTPLWVILAFCVCAGVGVGAAHVLPWAMLPDSMEWDELHSGGRHEGMHYSTITLGKKIASAVAIPAVFFLFGFSGFEANVAQLPSGAVLTIRLLAGPIPAVLLLVGILLAARYPLDRAAYEGVLSQLQGSSTEQESPS